MADRYELEWDEHNVGHISRHGVESWEAEEAMLDAGRIGVPAYNSGGELRRASLGATEAGRILFLVFARRERKIRVVTARDAEEKEKRRYRRR
jgi:uncharacterized DUF497 family protein